MKRYLFLLMVVLFPSLARTEGSVTVISVQRSATVLRYNLAWTAGPGGTVTAILLSEVKRGHLAQVQFVPGTGLDKPNDNYDVTLTVVGVDLLLSQGKDLDDLEATIGIMGTPYYYDATESIKLFIEHTGGARKGTVSLWFTP